MNVSFVTTLARMCHVLFFHESGLCSSLHLLPDRQDRAVGIKAIATVVLETCLSWLDGCAHLLILHSVLHSHSFAQACNVLPVDCYKNSLGRTGRTTGPTKYAITRKDQLWAAGQFRIPGEPGVALTVPSQLKKNWEEVQQKAAFGVNSSTVSASPGCGHWQVITDSNGVAMGPMTASLQNTCSRT